MLVSSSKIFLFLVHGLMFGEKKYISTEKTMSRHPQNSKRKIIKLHG